MESTKEIPKSKRPFNTPLETGLRTLFILNSVNPNFYDLQRLIFYDYLLVHSSDVPGGPPSLHPPLPYRAGEWLVRRKLVSDGLDLMISRELIERRFDKKGLIYGSTELTKPFLQYLNSEYAKMVYSISIWLFETFTPYTNEELTNFMIEHLGRWGAEFRKEAFLTQEKEHE